MPLPGGAADKAGNSYERRWTVLTLIDLLDGEAQSVRIEVPGDEGVGAEFRVLIAGVPVWHQAKRQRSEGAWTVTNLISSGIIATAWEKFQAGGQFVFVSGTSSDELKGLTEGAAKSESSVEFYNEFLKGGARRKATQKLSDVWGVPDTDTVYEALRCITVRTIDEEGLQDCISARLASLVTGPPAAAAALLAQLCDDSCHKTLTAPDVWAWLEANGVTSRGFSQDAQVVGRLAETVDGHLSRQRARHIAGRELERDEAVAAFAQLEDHQRVLVTGPAGYGKTVITAKVTEMARQAGWSVLVLSADRISSGTAIDVGTAMGLPDSPVTVLAGVAAGGDALLVLDQLDAVSVATGRHPERLAVVGDLLAQASRHPRLRVLLACREFDLDNDRELRSVAKEAGTIVVRAGPLELDAVQRVLRDEGLEEDLPGDLARLLTVPLHLAVYVDAARTGAAPVAARSLTELYGAYWQLKRDACTARRTGQDEWLPALRRLLDRSDVDQALGVPVAAVDDLLGQITAMASEGVLTVHGGVVSFLHETFLDYCYARLFVGDGRRLRADLSWADQDLFCRARVRQVLTYERSTSFTAYCDDLAWLITNDEVRPHLKALVIGLMQMVPDPKPEEWAILKPVAEDHSHPFHDRLWRALRRNPAWFPVLGADWGEWLSFSEPATVDLALWALSGMAAEHPGEAAGLVGTLPADEARPDRLRRFLALAPLGAGRPLVDLLISAIGAGLYDDDARDIWDAVVGVVKEDPAWAVDVLSVLFTRALAAGTANPFKGSGPLTADRQSLADEVLRTAAVGAPLAFATELLPHLLEIAHRNTSPNQAAQDVVREGMWGYRFHGEQTSLDDVFFHSMGLALERAAPTSPDELATALAQLRSDPHESAWFLLARAYAANPQRYADEAGRWLATTPGALHLGYSVSPHWASRQLIATLTPHCQDDVFDALVDALLGYTPPHERTFDALRYRGLGELCLLNGVDEGRRPERLHRRLAELRRKFLVDDVPPPQRIWAGTIPAPIPVEHARRMTDGQWLRAMSQYGVTDVRFTAGGRLVGDAATQAHVLEMVTAEQPDRFARLCLRIGTEIAEPYIMGILRGLGSAAIEPDSLLKVCAHAHHVGGADTQREILRLVEAHSAAALPDELLDLAITIAAAAAFDAADEPDLDQDMAGLNSTRGAAAIAFASLLAHDPSRLPPLRDPLAMLVSDTAGPVRAMAIAALTTVLHIAPPFALTEFRRAVADGDVLASRYVEGFLNTAIRRGHYGDLGDVISQMTTSADDAVRRVGVRQLTVASYFDPGLDPLVDAACEGDPLSRASVAEVFARNVTDPARRQRAFAMLVAAFDDPSPEVRAAAAAGFYRLDEQPIADYTPLIEAFSNSPALPEHSGTVLHMLEQARQALPIEVLQLCERCAEEPESRDVPGAFRAGTEHYLAQLAVRLHAQHAGGALRARCLDLIDRLVLLIAGGIDDHLSTVER